MEVVADASALIAELLRERGRRLHANDELRFSVSAHALSEVTHELPRRIGQQARHGRVPPGVEALLLSRALAIGDQHVRVFPPMIYADFEVVSRRRVPRDPHDWRTVALAMALEAVVWTADTDFLGCGLPTWITETLLLEVDTGS